MRICSPATREVNAEGLGAKTTLEMNDGNRCASSV